MPVTQRGGGGGPIAKIGGGGASSSTRSQFNVKLVSPSEQVALKAKDELLRAGQNVDTRDSRQRIRLLLIRLRQRGQNGHPGPSLKRSSLKTRLYA